jgi:hypothetical protein
MATAAAISSGRYWRHYTIDHTGQQTDYIHREAYRIRDDDPLSAEIEISFAISIGRGDWKTRSETWAVHRADRAHFHVEAKLGPSKTRPRSSRATGRTAFRGTSTSEARVAVRGSR